MYPRAYDSCLEIALLDIGNADLKAEEKEGLFHCSLQYPLLFGTFSTPIGALCRIQAPRSFYYANSLPPPSNTPDPSPQPAKTQLSGPCH